MGSRSCSQAETFREPLVGSDGYTLASLVATLTDLDLVEPTLAEFDGGFQTMLRGDHRPGIVELHGCLMWPHEPLGARQVPLPPNEGFLLPNERNGQDGQGWPAGS